MTEPRDLRKVIAAIDPYETGLTGGAVEVSQKWLDEGIDAAIVDLAEIRGGESSTGRRVAPEGLMGARPLDLLLVISQIQCAFFLNVVDYIPVTTAVRNPLFPTLNPKQIFNRVNIIRA
jgi:hypothetical protein